MAALLVALSVMAIMMGAALPSWSTWAQREKEAELVFRGEQYARAITLFQRRYANASPPNIDVLVNERFLRKKYKDPITRDDFQIITAGSALPAGQQQPPNARPPGSQTAFDLAREKAALELAAKRAQGQQGGSNLGIVGVTSKSPLKSFRLYRGQDTYNQWVFMGVQQSVRAGGPGGPAGQRGTGAGGRGGADGRGGRGAPPPLPGGMQPPRGRGVPPPPQQPGRGFIQRK
jgi:type II secretory pathway pseudopilin PulG